eukprot:TRINITY_DN32581_c0_g1_i1.p1 TRINITY_DN32581_c0_g1~~TRINITY_DN32581_c0_g1_i1.p1  ORF type:complete len:262 (-),score=45.35 TRINITY_DN32581_c0_g1_i1:78-863(-)
MATSHEELGAADVGADALSDGSSSTAAPSGIFEAWPRTLRLTIWVHDRYGNARDKILVLVRPGWTVEDLLCEARRRSPRHADMVQELRLRTMGDQPGPLLHAMDAVDSLLRNDETVQATPKNCIQWAAVDTDERVAARSAASAVFATSLDKTDRASSSRRRSSSGIGVSSEPPPKRQKYVPMPVKVEDETDSEDLVMEYGVGVTPVAPKPIGTPCCYRKRVGGRPTRVSRLRQWWKVNVSTQFFRMLNPSVMCLQRAPIYG